MVKKWSGRRDVLLSAILFFSMTVIMVSKTIATENSENSSSVRTQNAMSDVLFGSPSSDTQAPVSPTQTADSSSSDPETAAVFGSDIPAANVPIPQVDVLSALQDHSSVQALFDKPTQKEKIAFHAMTKSTMPMSPGQVIKLHRMLDLMQKAAAASPRTPPLPVVTTRLVKLAPGSTPPVIRLGQGFVSTVLFVDATGQPWPITGYDIGDAKSFNIQPPEKGGNMLMIQAMQPYTYGNMAVSLQGMTTPVMLTLVPGQRVVDYRVDLHINKMGPQALQPSGQAELPAPASDVLLDILNGVTPNGARVLNVSGGGSDNQAWLIGNRLYLRTRLAIISPAWLSMMRSADGTNAYEMATTPSILVSKAGQLVNLEIEGF